MTNYTDFQTVAEAAVANFADNSLILSLRAGRATIDQYVNLLKSLYFQVRESSSSFALAGAACEFQHVKIKEYLFHHADEEKTHWRWVLDDLRNLEVEDGWERGLFPGPATAAYIAFNFFVAQRLPVARLAIATVLEGIADQHGGTLGPLMARSLKLSSDQMTFFASHAVTDATHVVDLAEHLAEARLSSEDWDFMCFAARTAGVLYSNIYNEIASTQY